MKPNLIIALLALLLGITAPPIAAAGSLEIFSWWTNGGEADGLNALFEIYRAQDPSVEIINATVAGGAGVNAKAVLKTRMLGGDPPDSFQVHGGSELIDTWVTTGYMEPITSMWEEQGWLDVYPKELIDMVSYDGEIYSVPVNIHRGNVLWYNAHIFADHGLNPPKSFDEFFAVADKLKAAGIVPLSLASRDKWEVTHLFESILIGVGGAGFYRELVSGKLPWTDGRVKESLVLLKRMFAYINDDHATMTWDQASAYVLQGKAAMNVMGDWAKGYFTAAGWVPDIDFGALPSPGTEGIFMVVTDTFGLPKNAPNRGNVLRWLELLGSAEGQNAFNPLKGSIPARTDVSRAPYDSVSLRFMDDFASNSLTPSIAHGSALPESFAQAINDEMGLFLFHQDIDLAAQSLELQAQDLGLR